LTALEMGESFLPRETFPRFLFPEGEALGNAALCEVTESLGSRPLLPSGRLRGGRGLPRRKSK
jgi:hypothetical protein